MGDDDQRCLLSGVEVPEGLGEPLEAPQVDASLRLVEDRHLQAARQDAGDLDPLELAAREAGIQFSVQIVLGAQPHVDQKVAGVDAAVGTAGQVQEVAHRDSLEAGGLLEGVADAQAGPLVDVEGGDLLPVQEDLPPGGRVDPHDGLGDGGLPATVRACHHVDPVLLQGQADVCEDFDGFLAVVQRDAEVPQFQHGRLPLSGSGFRHRHPRVGGPDSFRKHRKRPHTWKPAHQGRMARRVRPWALTSRPGRQVLSRFGSSATRTPGPATGSISVREPRTCRPPPSGPDARNPVAEWPGPGP